jgi:protein phosphatase
MKIIPYALSDVGKKRDHNEDSYLVRDDVGLFAVADGMGGHQAGERASRMALDTLVGELKPPDDSNDRKDVLACLRDATQAAGAAIFDAAQADPGLQGMGTTLTSLWFHRGRAYLAHVGDSRAYLFRDGRVQQLSDDHSWVSEQVRAGMMTEEEARESKFRHIITRSVGFEREVLVDGAAIPVQAGDCYVICSDGLSNYVEAEELARLLTSRFYRDVPRLLVELANDRGGDDNITVVLVHIANDGGASNGHAAIHDSAEADADASSNAKTKTKAKAKAKAKGDK